MVRPAGSTLPPAVWFLLALVAAGLIVAGTTKPSFSNPQLEPDDYRYLSHVQELERDFFGNIREASVVENRWDHLWWVESRGVVRFFRPLVVLSYWLDKQVHGDNVIKGLLLSNVLLYLACVVLVWLILTQWTGQGLPALLGVCLFASFYCHGEVLWYIAGRTDTLAALGFLAGLAAHNAGRRRPWVRYLALPCYAAALATKESTIGLPIVVLLHDIWLDQPSERPWTVFKRQWKLYASYAVTASLILAARHIALAGAKAELVFPYFVSPLGPEFPGHLWRQFRTYSENLLLARETMPFLGAIDVPDHSSWWGLALTLLVGVGVGLFLRRDRLFHLWLSLALLAWLPASVVYISERYLLLPSVAVAGMLALSLRRLQPRRHLFYLGVALSLLWIGHQGYRLERKHAGFAEPREAQLVAGQIAAVTGQIPRAADLVVLNLPGSWLQAQFLEQQLRVQLQDPAVQVRVLTVMPTKDAMGSGLEQERQGTDVLVLRGGKFPWAAERFPLLERSRLGFSWIGLNTGTRVGSPHLGFSVEILSGTADRCEALRLEFARPLEEYTVLEFVANPDGSLSPWDRFASGRVRVGTL